MAKQTKRQYMYILLGLLIILLIILFSKVYEGFFSTTSTSNAKSTIDSIIQDNMQKMNKVINDMAANRYTIDVTSAISNINKEISDTTTKKSQNTILYLTTRKNQLSNIQTNLNNINSSILNYAQTTNISQISDLNNSDSTQNVSIIQAIQNANLALNQISKDLSQIPDN